MLHRFQQKEATIMKQYKVIIWGLGNVGRAAVRMIGERKSVKLVAAVDIDPNKVGKDAAGVLPPSCDLIFSLIPGILRRFLIWNNGYRYTNN